MQKKMKFVKCKNMIEKKEGITLIALVVTIIVLLILAGITINATLGNNGLISQSETASNKVKEDDERKQEEINRLAGEVEKWSNGTTQSVTP